MEDNLESGLDANPEATPEPTTSEIVQGVQSRLPMEVDPEKLAQLQAMVEQIKKGEGETASGSEARPIPNLEDYEVPPDKKHLYERAQWVDDDQGGHWEVVEHQYWIETASYNSKRGSFRGDGFPNRPDDICNMIVNGPEGLLSWPKTGWHLSAMIPNGSGMVALVFERDYRHPLEPLKEVPKETPVAPVKDEELRRMEDQAKEWEASQTGEPDVGQGS